MTGADGGKLRPALNTTNSPQCKSAPGASGFCVAFAMTTSAQVLRIILMLVTEPLCVAVVPRFAGVTGHSVEDLIMHVRVVQADTN